MSTTENLEATIEPESPSRCWWPGTDELYCTYHDNEWGRPVDDDTRLFEKVCLEGFQAGLSWITILRKREAFREAFDGFDIEAVSRFDEDRVQALLTNAGIVRHQGKIRSTINNAQRALELQAEQGSLARHFWGSVTPVDPDAPAPVDIPGSTPESAALSKDLRKRGWSFVGPTTIYAFMQSVGMVNDHVEGCEWHRVCAELPRPERGV